MFNKSQIADSLKKHAAAAGVNLEENEKLLQVIAASMYEILTSSDYVEYVSREQAARAKHIAQSYGRR